MLVFLKRLIRDFFTFPASRSWIRWNSWREFQGAAAGNRKLPSDFCLFAQRATYQWIGPQRWSSRKTDRAAVRLKFQNNVFLVKKQNKKNFTSDLSLTFFAHICSVCQRHWTTCCSSQGDSRLFYGLRLHGVMGNCEVGGESFYFRGFSSQLKKILWKVFSGFPGIMMFSHTSRGVLSVRQAENLHPSTCVVAAEGTKRVILCFSRGFGGKKQSVLASLSAVQSTGRPLLSLDGATRWFREGNTLPCRHMLRSIQAEWESGPIISVSPLTATRGRVAEPPSIPVAAVYFVSLLLLLFLPQTPRWGATVPLLATSMITPGVSSPGWDQAQGGRQTGGFWAVCRTQGVSGRVRGLSGVIEQRHPPPPLHPHWGVNTPRTASQDPSCLEKRHPEPRQNLLLSQRRLG